MVVRKRGVNRYPSKVHVARYASDDRDCLSFEDIPPVVTVGIAEATGHPIKFFAFMKCAFAYMLISVAICNVWLLIFY